MHSNYLNRFRSVSCLKLEEASCIPQLIQMLGRKRIDLFIDAKDAVDYTLKTELPEYKDEIQPVQPYFEVDKIYFVVSKKHPDHRQITSDFDRGIALMKSDGAYQAILDTHGIHHMASE